MKLGMAAVALVAFIVVQGAACASVPLPGAPQYANNILSDFVTPTVAPGQSLVFAFNVSNPYDDHDAVMTNVMVTVGIYRYATQEELKDVDDGFDNPPVFDDGQTEQVVDIGELRIGSTERVSLEISTTKDTPHGSYFMQSTYFVRISMTFNFEDNETAVVLKSKGFFTDEEWDEMVSFDPDESLVDIAYMNELGVDGLLPDSSFGLKIPIPRWPLALLVIGCASVSFMALYHFVLDNPGKYPKLEKRFYKLRRKLRELRCQFEHVLRKR
jgi:hypothetical protein